MRLFPENYFKNSDLDDLAISLHILSNRVTRALDRLGATQPVALDMTKAFDKVWHAGVLNKLISYTISGWLFGLIL